MHRIMTDRDMIQLPVQSRLGPWIAKRRTEEVQKKYKEIGGGSPILKWTNIQGLLAIRKELFVVNTVKSNLGFYVLLSVK